MLDAGVQFLDLASHAAAGKPTCANGKIAKRCSAVLLLGRKLDEVFFGVYWPNVVAIVLVLSLAVAVSLIFDSDTKKGAFYLGASVLAILMTLTPYEVAPGFKTEPHSVEVDLSITTPEGKPVKGALVTLRDASGSKILSRSKLPTSQLRFFQDEGTYRLTIELNGYRTVVQRFSVREGTPPQALNVVLQPSSTPLVIQRILR